MNVNESVRAAPGIPVSGKVPSVDFESHPAFSRNGVDAPRDREAEKILEGIEAACQEIGQRPTTSHQAFKSQFDASIRPRFRELADLATGHPAMSPAFREYARGAIDQAAGFLLDYLQSRTTPDAGAPQLKGSAVTRLETLQRDGFCRLDVGGGLAQEVWRSTWWERGILRQRAGNTPGRHCALALNDYSAGSLAIQRALRENGVLDVASAYIGRPMEFLYAALDHNHDQQTWYRDCYIDVGLSTSRTAYLHFDADSDVLKAMLYLKDVGPENGPFSYVRGSHRWERSAAQCALNRGFDVQQTQTFEMVEDRLDYKLGYYRPRYKLPEYRAGLLLLPRVLRGSTHFGDDILDGTPLSESLLRQEEVFVEPAGTLILFDGSKGIHRGSLVERGERWAVQIAMRAISGKASRRGLRASVRALRASVRARLRYQIDRAKSVLSFSAK